jgi:hypothetical protein
VTGPDAPPMMNVQARIPQLVFVQGRLLPHGAFGIEQSPVQPTVCDVVIVSDHPRLPPDLRHDLADIVLDQPSNLPEPLADLRVFQGLVADGRGLVFVEMTVRQIKMVTQKPPGKSGSC